MLGELYANGLGVKRDYVKADDWYKRAVDAGDREAIVRARDDADRRPRRPGGQGCRGQAAGVVGQARRSPRRPIISRCSISTARPCRRTSSAPPSCCAWPPDAGSPEAQYALATFYKEGTGVPKDLEKAARLLQAASLADNVDAEVEYAIALYNGTGTPRNVPAAVAMLRKAARQNSAIAQNRLAHVLATGAGRAGRQGRGPEMAHRRQDRRQGRPRSRRHPRRHEPGRPRQGRGSCPEMDRQQRQMTP